jgi:hypothetical protein
VQLVSASEAQGQELWCRVCGAEARVVPSCGFSASEREHFDELSEIVAETNVTPLEAGDFVAEVQRALWSGAYTATLETLSVRLLGLLPMQVAAGKNSAAQRRILIKLKTIFEALATARRSSAEYPKLAGAERGSAG